MAIDYLESLQLKLEAPDLSYDSFNKWQELSKTADDIRWKFEEHSKPAEIIQALRSKMANIFAKQSIVNQRNKDTGKTALDPIKVASPELYSKTLDEYSGKLKSDYDDLKEVISNGINQLKNKL